MSILKNKIALAKKSLSNNDEHQQKKTKEPQKRKPKSTNQNPEAPKPEKRPKKPRSFATSERDRATKNIVKNYGKAICSFACSEIAKPYLEPLLEEKKVSRNEFTRFISQVKESIDSIQSFRALLLIRDEDTPELAGFKKLFAAIGEVFIKYFSVNWIFSGRITHRDAHLKFRFKMLRRIQNPEFFTYLKQSHERNF